MSEESKEKQERAPSARSPEEVRRRVCAEIVDTVEEMRGADRHNKLNRVEELVDAAIRSAEQRGREHGTEEAARLLDVEADNNDDSYLRHTAAEIRALNGNRAAPAAPSSLSDPSPPVVQDNQQVAATPRSLTEEGRRRDAQALNETAYLLWIACRDKGVSTDAIRMIVQALLDAEQRGRSNALANQEKP